MNRGQRVTPSPTQGSFALVVDDRTLLARLKPGKQVTARVLSSATEEPSFHGVDGLAAEPVVLGTDFEADEAVAVVGYTSKKPGMSPEVEEILTEIFGTIFNLKSLAPWRLLSVSEEELTYDSSTQGDNSGSAILDLETGHPLGLHFAGGLFENSGLPAVVLDRRLQEVA